jgi:hypothetical protein
MVYIMPASKWDDYKDNKQSKLLTDVKDAIKARYPSTEVKVDRLVVAIKYQNFHVEVQPVLTITIAMTMNQGTSSTPIQKMAVAGKIQNLDKKWRQSKT